MAQTENMNRGRAEAHLRLLAEEELRRAAILVPDGAAGGAGGAGRGGTGLDPVQYWALVRLAAALVRDIPAA